VSDVVVVNESCSDVINDDCSPTIESDCSRVDVVEDAAVEKGALASLVEVGWVTISVDDGETVVIIIKFDDSTTAVNAKEI